MRSRLDVDRGSDARSAHPDSKGTLQQKLPYLGKSGVTSFSPLFSIKRRAPRVISVDNPSLQEEPSEQSCEYGEFETPKCSIVPIYVHSGHGSGVAVWKSLGDAGVVD